MTTYNKYQESIVQQLERLVGFNPDLVWGKKNSYFNTKKDTVVSQAYNGWLPYPTAIYEDQAVILVGYYEDEDGVGFGEYEIWMKD
jgi:hypothetical protein